MGKEFRSLVITSMLLFALFFGGCAAMQTTATPPLETYSFELDYTYNEGSYSMLLPECIPMPPEDAVTVEDLPHMWWPISAIHIYYM